MPPGIVSVFEGGAPIVQRYSVRAAFMRLCASIHSCCVSLLGRPVVERFGFVEYVDDVIPVINDLERGLFRISHALVIA
jgi:hypothetical protein